MGQQAWTEAPPSAVSDQVPLACGSGADVFRGVMTALDGTAQHVVLRRPRITSAAAMDRFEHEVALRATLRHPSILPLVSACTRPPHYCTVSPLIAGGDMFDAVHARGARFDFARALALSAQLARAMTYLHARNIVHRDFKSANVLLDQELANAWVADLDLAADVDVLKRQAGVANGRAMHRGPSNGRLSHMVGTLVYLAPEVLQGAPHSFPADVYAFAVTVNEITSATVPYVDRELPEPELHTVLESRFNDMTLRRAITKDKLRPVLARNVPPEFSSLISRAWAAKPADRPTFEAILQELDAIVAKGDAYLSKFGASTEYQITAPGREDQQLDSSVSIANLVEELHEHKCHPLKPSWTTAASSKLPAVLAAVSSTCGARGDDRMEDTAIVLPNLGDQLDIHLFAVFDGHAGARCSQFAAETLPAAIYRSWSRPDTDPSSVLTHAFQDTDAAFLYATPDSEQSGCTALAALVDSSTLYVANAGDCRCVTGRQDGATGVVTKDHVGTDADERARVEARGGKVDPVTGRVEGKLMVSRAMGDRKLKRYVPATPDVFIVPLTSDIDFAVLATDGLWDVVTSEEAVDLVRSTVRKADLAAKRLALKAIELGSGDNISVIVIFFDWNKS